jgi:hypothetical protein
VRQGMFANLMREGGLLRGRWRIGLEQ